MAIPTLTHLNTTTALTVSGAGTVVTASFSATGGTAHPLIVIVRQRVITDEITVRYVESVVWSLGGGQALTKKVGVSNTNPGSARDRTTEIFVLDNPTAGSGTITVDPDTTNGNCQSMSITVYEVATDFDSFGTNFGSNTGGSGDTVTASVTTTRANSEVLGGFFVNNPNGTDEAAPFTPVSGTELVDSQTGANSSNSHGFTDLRIDAATVGSYALTTTPTFGSFWSGCSIEIRSAADTTVNPTGMAMTMGLGTPSVQAGGDATIAPAGMALTMTQGGVSLVINDAGGGGGGGRLSVGFGIGL